MALKYKVVGVRIDGKPPRYDRWTDRSKAIAYAWSLWEGSKDSLSEVYVANTHDEGGGIELLLRHPEPKPFVTRSVVVAPGDVIETPTLGPERWRWFGGHLERQDWTGEWKPAPASEALVRVLAPTIPKGDA